MVLCFIEIPVLNANKVDTDQMHILDIKETLVKGS